jgi:DNA-binding response OmpR family regulator
MKALLVDDEQELVSTLAERLAIRGIEADWVTSGEEALMICEKNAYDVAILDIKIPRISGVTLKKSLQEKYPTMKFIFMTGHGSEDEYNAGSAEAGTEYYLVKPVDINLLIERMTTALKT